MKDKIPNRTALVTGASRGIGRAIAVALAKAHYQVAINFHRNQVAADESASLVEQAGSRSVLVQADMADAPDRRRLVDQVFDEFGSLDLLVNNAGVAPKVRTDLLEMDPNSYDTVLNTNLKGPFFLAQNVAREMIKRKHAGSIVNISSISAYTASINRGEYCIAKAGMAMTTQLLAARLAPHGIGVYEIRPGIIETDMTTAVKEKYDKLILEEDLVPIRRWGQPQDVAAAVCAIAEGHLGYSTGEVINVDGGFHLRTL